MDLLQASEKFCQFLSTLIKPLEPRVQRLTQSSTLFFNEYTCTILPPRVQTVFTNFTGPVEETVVIISKRQSTKHAQERNDESYELCASMTESYEKSSDDEDEFGDETACDVNPLISCQYVNTGQPLSQKRVYLTASHPLYAGQEQTSIVCTFKGFEATLAPLSLDKARYVCSLYALGCRRFKSTLPNIWVICKSEKQKIVSLGCSYNLQKSSLLSYTVSKKDPILEVQMNATQKLPLPSITKSRGSLNQTQVYSEYEITTSSGSMDDKVYGRVAVQFAWSNPDGVLSPPAESAEAVLRISTTPGYKYSPVLSTYNEVSNLLRLCKISCGDESWLPLDCEEPRAAPAKMVSTRTDSFLEEVASPLSQPLEVTVISPAADSTVLESRKDLDFVERLWIFAKDATSLEDLQQIFAVVFKAVLLGQVQPFIHRNNSSILATLLHQVLVSADPEERQLLAPKFQALLSESKILPCLVQLGIDKLRRDYRTFFVGADLATSDQLEHFFNSKASLLKQCLSVCNLHNVVELNASALSFLDLPTAMLSSLTKTSLEFYKEKQFNGFTTTPVFSLPVPAFSAPLKSLISLCLSLKPKLWILSQTSGSGCCVTVYGGQPMIQNSENSTENEPGNIAYYVYSTQCILIM